MESRETQVLVVGGGGCGLSASNFLSDHGVEHILVERHPGTATIPKAHYLNQRTMEIYRQHELADDILAKAAPLDSFGKLRWMTTLAGDEPAAGQVIFELDAFGGGGLRETYRLAGPALPSKLPQVRLEPILRRQAEDRNPGNVLFGYDMVSFAQRGEGVDATIQEVSTGRLSTVRCRYVIAADGGRSIGPKLQIPMEGPPITQRVTSAYFSADLSEWWPEGSQLTHFFHPTRPELCSNLIEMGPSWGKDCAEWVLHFPPSNSSSIDEDSVIGEIRAVLGIPHLEVTLHHLSKWSVDAVVARQFSCGRIFLVGDAAHRQPPTVGLGLNSGIQDVHNLAWKLALVLSGRAPDTLLASYHDERRPVCQLNVSWAVAAAMHHQASLDALGFGAQSPPGRRAATFKTFFEESPLGAAARERTQQVLATHRGACQAHDLEIGFAYEAGAVVPDGSRPPDRAPLRDDYVPTTRPGHRLPHSWLQRAGEVISTHDVVGRSTSFALLFSSGADGWRDAADVVNAEGMVTVLPIEIGPDGEYLDATGAWARVRGVTSRGAVLVRPDNHVGWRCVHGSVDHVGDLQGALRQILATSTGAAADPDHARAHAQAVS